MRIQHNIPAMGAYRSYSKNASALSGNLEKLSSGYRVNRSADDAAGLAISEKMRAQISGLERAQLNAKDGISLVQTAEGALSEVHDMLDRMVSLSEQSANGTYDNDTDRVQLQKEMDQLKTEINRIADSSNFNGILLLDGSLSPSGGSPVEVSLGIPDALPNAGDVLFDNTVLHQEENKAEGVGFSIELHNVEFSNEEGSTMSIQIGNDEFVLKGDGKDPLNSAAIVDAFLGGKFELQNPVTGQAVTVGASTEPGAKPGTKQIMLRDDKTGKLTTYNVEDNGTTITMTKQGSSPDQDGAKKVVLKGNNHVLNEGSNGGPGAIPDPLVKATMTGHYEGNGRGPVSAAFSWNSAVVKDNKDLIALSDWLDGSKSLDVAWKTNTGGPGNPDTNPKPTVTAEVGFSSDPPKGITVEYSVGGTKLTNTTGNEYTVAMEQDTVPNLSVTFKAGSTTLGTLEVTNGFNFYGAGVGEDFGYTVDLHNPTDADIENGLVSFDTLTGDYNVSTTNITNQDALKPERLASTKFTLKEQMVEDGASIRIGDENYYFQGKQFGSLTESVDTANPHNHIVKTWDLDQTDPDYLANCAVRLTAAAADNPLYSVGTGNAKTVMTLTEHKGCISYEGTDVTNTKGGTAYDLRTEDGIRASLGFTGPVAKGGSMKFQIGDTSDDFNQLTIAVNDCHTSSLKSLSGDMSVADIDISTQEGAAKALNVIKDAVNYISDVRGTLGATQNRLEHSISNIAVMRENIQDAESSIRDTDVAEEMMEYTKNSILTQASQSMLAQANQTPQGVLQLVQ